jgi:hypothetical protein
LQRTVNVHETLPIELIDDSPLQKIRSGSVTRRAAEVMRATDEEMVWEESPSPVLLASTASKYLAAIFGAALLAGFLHTGWYWAGFCLLIGMVHVGIGCLKLRCMSYRLSSQRLEITQGVLNQKTVTWEVHQLGSSEISSPLTLRLFQRSTLVITNPFIELSGIRESRRVRDFLRNTGQSEAQRVDKIRWR